MKKGLAQRAQTTVFIIIAIVIVAAGVGGYFYYSEVSSVDKAFFSSSEIKPQVNNIKDSVVGCIEEVSKGALDVTGIQGGYYKEPPSKKDYFDLGWAFIPYYYDKGRFLMPTNTKIENELEKYVNENLELCLGELSFEGFEVSNSNPRTTASINSNEVEFKVDMTTKISKEEKKINFKTKDFPSTINSDLKSMLEIAKYITNSHKEDPEMICISCVADMAEEEELYVDMLDMDTETATLVVISTNKTSINPPIFEFLNRYPDNIGESEPTAQGL